MNLSRNFLLITPKKPMITYLYLIMSANAIPSTLQSESESPEIKQRERKLQRKERVAREKKKCSLGLSSNDSVALRARPSSLFAKTVFYGAYASYLTRRTSLKRRDRVVFERVTRIYFAKKGRQGNKLQ